MSNEKKNITKTNGYKFDYAYHYTLDINSDVAGNYPLHVIDIFCEFRGMDAIFQQGERFLCGDYNSPDPDVYLSEGGGTDPKLIELYNYGAELFEDYAVEQAEEMAKKFNISVKNLYELYIDLCDLENNAQYYYNSLFDDDNIIILTFEDFIA